MNIKKLELNGFKSFAEKTKILFHSGITAVIGPNGTGKSNIVDALLWVLGAKRFKSLRGERSADIIFNGNKTKAPFGMADVQLFLENASEEITVHRRLFRSGESEYRMDGKTVRLKDIQDTLWKSGIGDTEYFVIEQGSIGLFLSSKPVEKRLLLEEAAGTAYYKEKKRQAQNKLQNSEQNLDRLEDIIEEVSKAKNSLQRQARAALRYKKLREEIRELTLLQYRKKIHHREQSHKEASGSYQKKLEQENQMLSRMKTEEQKLATLRKDSWELETSLKEDQKNLYELANRLSRLESEKERKERHLEDLKEKSLKNTKSIEEHEFELAALEKEESEAEARLKTLKNRLSRVEKDLQSAEVSGTKARESLDVMQKTLGALRHSYFQNISSLTEQKNERVKIEKEIELTLLQEEKLSVQIESERKFLLQNKKRLEKTIREFQKIQENLEIKHKKEEEAKKERTRILNSEENLKKQKEHLENHKKGHIHHLQALERLRQNARKSGPSSHFPRSMGLLADLIEWEARHTPLVDAFWKEEGKAACIPVEDFLKTREGNFSETDFLLLSSGKKEDSCKEVLQSPLALGLLKSSIKPSPLIKDFFTGFPNAVIVKDIPNAISLWLRFPSANFVTLEGDVLFSSGYLKLRKEKEGLFSISKEIKDRSDSLASIEKDLDPLLKELSKLESQKKTLEEGFKKLSAEVQELEMSMALKEKERASLETEQGKTETRLKLLKEERAILKASRSELEKNHKNLHSQVIQRENESESLRSKIEKKEARIVSFQEENDSKRKSFFELQSTHDILREKIDSLEKQIQSLKKSRQNVSSKKRELENEIQICEEEGKRTRESLQRLKKESQAAEDKKQGKENESRERESSLRDISERREEKERALEKCKQEHEAAKEERIHWEVKKAERERDLVNLEESCWQELKKTFKEIKEQVGLEHALAKAEEIESELGEAEEKLQKLTAVNLMAEEEYEAQKKRHDFLLQQQNDLRESIESTKKAIKKIDKESQAQFLKALNEVNQNFQDVFNSLFEGGHAELKLTDESQPLESGIEIIAQPPEKKLQSLSLLSGGEKSLTSLAFFFALFRYKPAPFCIFDEVDAALDEANLSRFLNLLRKAKSQTQFIIITHNFKTMEVADYIYGTTMGEPNITSLYSVKLDRKEAKENA